MKSLVHILLALVACSSAGLASHFRFAHLNWRRVAGAPNPRTIEITYTEAWRASAPASFTYNLGDGSTFSTSAAPTIATLTDLAGEVYVVRRVIATKTYATDGPFTVTASGCCRIGSLVNAGDASERFSAIIDLRGGNLGSPSSSVPVILQMSQGVVNNVQLPVADPDGDPVTFRMATAAESSIPSVASAGGNTLTVSSSGLLSWNTAATVVGQKYAVQVHLAENHPGGTSGTGYLDFIIEITGGTVNQPPTCTGTMGTTVVPVGTPFTATVIGTDPEGANLTLNHLGLPPGATITPANGSTGASPRTATVSWTPTAADRGSAYTVTLLFTDPLGLQAQCSFGIQVPAGDAVPPTTSCTARVIASGKILTVGATDAGDPNPSIYLKDGIGTYIAGPFRSGDLIHVRLVPGATPYQTRLFTGTIAYRVQCQGAPLIYATDASGNSSTPVLCP